MGTHEELMEKEGIYFGLFQVQQFNMSKRYCRPFQGLR